MKIARSFAAPVAVTVALAASLFAPAARAAEPAAPAQADRPVAVKLVKTSPPGGGTWIAASVAAARRATISTRISATVVEVPVSEGARVAQGQLLVRLSDADIRGALEAAETALRTAAAHEKRITELAAARASIPAELDQAQAQRAQAEAAVAAARTTLGYAQVRAPFAGTVQARRVNKGDLVGPGQPLVEIEAGDLEIQATLSDAEAKGLKIGQRLRFTTGDLDGEAVITALTPGGDPLAHRRALRARVVQGGPDVLSGAFARLEVPGASRAPSVWLPRSAIVERGDLTGVFVAENGKAHLRWLALGDPMGDLVPVRAGLKPGEAVIDAPGALRDGQRVEVSHGG